MGKFEELRAAHRAFFYNGYEIIRNPDHILIRYGFVMEGLCEFRPEIRVMTDNLALVNPFDGETARKLIFSLGLVEAVSYWKAACPGKVVIRCGAVSGEQALWWKKLWWGGLGEFFYRNGIVTDFDSFVNFDSLGETVESGAGTSDIRLCGLNLVPVGGGKDSAVTLSLLHGRRDSIRCFTINDQPARTGTVLAAGLPKDSIVRTYRTIDPELLRLNGEGYLNGHTPFSAVAAFLSLYCAYLIGAENIILSNESSANEPSVPGADVNHQYSKSFDFENDFLTYTRQFLDLPIRYFSLLRPFNELQIAKRFAALPQYHGIFKSCNAGSRQNVWCRQCAKCLFVYIILAPFLRAEELNAIFGENLLERGDLSGDFLALAGFSDTKPFECIGTVSEVGLALALTVRKYTMEGVPLPALLRLYQREKSGEAADETLLAAFDEQHNIPKEFLSNVKEMYRFVTDAD
ncbi:MAG: hypothetical protein FWF05_04815 [Oscillospiraceae bacterium]|nr:hypothetical protein [Oscillospiraceae bacterium]